jgi:hypothetical protein
MNDEDLRDLFAGLAMQGMMTKQNPDDYKVCAIYAYRAADAMLVAKYAQSEVGIKAAKPRRKKADV